MFNTPSLAKSHQGFGLLFAESRDRGEFLPGGGIGVEPVGQFRGSGAYIGLGIVDERLIAGISSGEDDCHYAEQSEEGRALGSDPRKVSAGARCGHGGNPISSADGTFPSSIATVGRRAWAEAFRQITRRPAAMSACRRDWPTQCFRRTVC